MIDILDSNCNNILASTNRKSLTNTDISIGEMCALFDGILGSGKSCCFVSHTNITKQILRKKGDKEISSLNNLILKEQEENKANVTKYAKEQLAAANSKLFDNKGYVQLEMAKALSQNTKFFFSGEGSPLGSVLAKIMGNGL